MVLPQSPNQRWSLDFQSDALADGRRRRPAILCVCSDEMRDFGCVAQMEALYAFFDQAIGVCDPLVLAQVLGPRCDEERLDHASFVGGILEHAPTIGAVAATLVSELLKEL